ncbi:MAG: GldG family protein [candidate division KSB1 bacterium]|nr:GldG family protein [candidate division KSB1 bacterium]MDZ7301405.1 GldG family protein [candidate division KSB1 bacterium]MDZ7310710.1 GldG family protein [candidate division KSB1 bacterium]
MDRNFHTGGVGKFSDWPAAVFFLLGLAFLNNAVGPTTRQTNLAAAVAMFALFLINILSQRDNRNAWPAIGFLTAFLHTTFLIAYRYVPPIWHFAQVGGQFVSHSIAALFGQQQLFGATAFGLPILALFISFILSAHLLSDRSKQLSWLSLLLTVFALLVIHALWVVLQEPALKFLSRFLAHDHYQHAHLTPLHLLIIPFLLDLIPTYFFVRTCTFSQISFTAPKLKKLTAIGTAGAFFLIAVILSWPDFVVTDKNKKNIFLFNRGYFNWEKPKFGQYGLTSAGMFGLLPDYLRALDYNVTVDSLLAAEALQNAHVLVVINLHRTPDKEEKQTIARFVENGGALLVLGDHTGLGEIMPPLNDVLKDTGIQFNFDSAHYLKDGWNHAFELMPHPINATVKNEDDVGISVGASLALSPFKAWPVITAKYGFSNFGNWLNKQNAYLGDRSYNPGELLGDIVLVAEGKWGKGKVLVFGDTSSLQNGALARAFTFVDGMLHWLAHTKRGAWQSFHIIIGALLLLVTTILLLRFFHHYKNMALVIIAFGGLVLGFLFTSALAANHKHQTVPTGQIAYIDMSHLERFQIYGDDGVWSLLYTLMRSDCLPFVHQRFSPSALKESKVFVKIAPAKPLSDDELPLVDDYLQQGGLVVWAVGYEEKEGSEKFLRRYGLDIDNVPLGPVPKDQTDRGLYFHKAWPIIFSDSSDVEVLCTGWGYPVIIAQKIGKGRLVLIGDSEFLLARNLEGAPRVREENLRFIESLVKSRGMAQK